jgi:cell division initiation protein
VIAGKVTTEDDVEMERGGGSLTPAAIRNMEPKRVWLRGYRRDDVHHLLDDVADELAAAVRERDEVATKLASLEVQLRRHRELESLLSSTLVSAERAAREATAQATRESDLIVREAHAEARRTIRQAAVERRHLEDGMVELRARLRAVMGLLSGSDGSGPSARADVPAEAAVEPASTTVAPESDMREVVA